MNGDAESAVYETRLVYPELRRRIQWCDRAGEPEPLPARISLWGRLLDCR